MSQKSESTVGKLQTLIMNSSEIRIHCYEALVQITSQTPVTLVLDLFNRPQKPRADITKKVALDGCRVTVRVTWSHQVSQRDLNRRTELQHSDVQGKLVYFYCIRRMAVSVWSNSKLLLPSWRNNSLCTEAISITHVGVRHGAETRTTIQNDTNNRHEIWGTLRGADGVPSRINKVTINRVW